VLNGEHLVRSNPCGLGTAIAGNWPYHVGRLARLWGRTRTRAPAPPSGAPVKPAHCVRI